MMKNKVSIRERIAAAPISWGVWEANGASGWTLPPDLYLRQVQELGLTATEFGPEGWLPVDGRARKALLDAYGLQSLGAFVPVLLFKKDHDPLPEVEKILDNYVQAGASTIIYAALSGGQGYNDRPTLSAAEWTTFFANLDRLVKAAKKRNITPTLHHHMGTIIQTADEIDRLLTHSEIGLCLDTGHAMIAGIHPIDLAKKYGSRINFVHLKDVNNAVAKRVQKGELMYMDALSKGIFHPLGSGEAQIGEIVMALEEAGYRGWYVMEQDAILASEDDLAATFNDIKESLAFLWSLSE
ncbi:TIM barrel protein [Brenneria goodwinii]|nr:TIM barrel protein [Brenneria goodwinii]MCG8157217.1 TIM barrel protein [Brenneria goodwinii]MCG8163643.1 TIM barrel protein [Brenneria goodwinii]MCG8166101.1 TIM barrel protein [Brenneria goodwinii]MCG8170728.1 TIM barrel protein [Brenneria goodwinii]MCG8175797.1 TIM barrel protein [Brenneria goodwinii]